MHRFQYLLIWSLLKFSINTQVTYNLQINPTQLIQLLQIITKNSSKKLRILQQRPQTPNNPNKLLHTNLIPLNIPNILPSFPQLPQQKMINRTIPHKQVIQFPNNPQSKYPYHPIIRFQTLSQYTYKLRSRWQTCNHIKCHRYNLWDCIPNVWYFCSVE